MKKYTYLTLSPAWPQTSPPHPPPTHLVRVQGDPQAQLGHAVLLQQLEVGAQCGAEGPGHVLRQPAVVGGVAQPPGLVLALQEEHLQGTEVQDTDAHYPGTFLVGFNVYL